MKLIPYFATLLLGVIHFCHRGGAVLMWTAPPPAWNQTFSGDDEVNIQTAVIQVLNGSTNVVIKWNYNLLGNQSIWSAYFTIDAEHIGVASYGKSEPAKDFRNRFSIETTSEFSSLTINEVTERENATFRCKLYLEDRSFWAYDIRIQVTVSPKITDISADRTVNLGDIVPLKCTAEGYPVPRSTWTKMSDSSVVTSPLTIASKQDEGIYRCTADNGAGRPDSRDVAITVTHPPEIITPQTSTWNVIAGDTLTIECHANGRPSPRYEWTNADGRVITNQKTLRLDEVNDSHGGIYTCTATNRLGSDSFRITVQMESTSTSTKPSAAPSTTSVPPGNKERRTFSDNTRKHTLIGVGLGGSLVVVGAVAVAVWRWRKDSKRQKREHFSQNNQNQRGGGDCHHYVDMEGFQNTRPRVDRSKKPKKKPKPGEVNYADLAIFQRSNLSLIPSSSHPPPPIKKPPPYVKTEYADITHVIRAVATDSEIPATNTVGNIAGNMDSTM